MWGDIEQSNGPKRRKGVKNNNSVFKNGRVMRDQSGRYLHRTPESGRLPSPRSGLFQMIENENVVSGGLAGHSRNSQPLLAGSLDRYVRASRPDLGSCLKMVHNTVHNGIPRHRVQDEHAATDGNSASLRCELRGAGLSFSAAQRSTTDESEPSPRMHLAVPAPCQDVRAGRDRGWHLEAVLERVTLPRDTGDPRSLRWV